jgi:hypothetical protein
MVSNGSTEHVLSVLNWAPFRVFEGVVGHLLLEHSWTDHPGGTWEVVGERIQGRLVSASDPDVKKFAWMEATRGANLPPVTIQDLKAFAARAAAIGASAGIYISTARLPNRDIDESLKIRRPPLTILDGGYIVFLLDMMHIDLQFYLDNPWDPSKSQSSPPIT